jgi:ubiquinol-cytochrome c reductase cytochrome c subunit
MRRIGIKALTVASLGLLAFAIVALAQAPSGIVHPPNEPGKAPLQLGSELFAANCASCHGIDGRGVSTSNPVHGAGDFEGAGPDLQGVGAQAADFYLRTGRMPIKRPGDEPERHRPYFNETELRALTAYVASLGPGPGIPHPKPDESHVSRGMELFTDHCAGCHQIVGQGGYVTDARVPVLQHASATQIAEAVRIGPYLMPRFSQRAITDRQLDDLIAYVRYAQHPGSPGGLAIGDLGPWPEGAVTWLIAVAALVAVCMLLGKRLKP